jgi:hypothetical protein
MTPCIQYTNARLVAHAVCDELRERGLEDVRVRLLNRYKPDNTLWWVVPSTEWPAYKYGKLFFSTEREYVPAGFLFCGLHVEKGLGPKAEGPHTSALIMRSDWLWSSFLSDLGSDKLSPAIARASDATGEPTIIIIKAAVFVQNRGSSASDDRQWVRFESSDGSTVKATKPSNSGHLLDNLLDSQSLSVLVEHISAVPNPDWVWLDVLIGNQFELMPSVNHSVAWDSLQLWKKVLSVWETWFK